MDTMHEWIFVAPRGHMATLVAFLDRALQTLPGVPASKVVLPLSPFPLCLRCMDEMVSCNSWLVSLLGRTLQWKQPASQ